MLSLHQSARVVRALVTVSCLFSAVQACGGRSDTEDYLFGADGTITVGATANNSAGNGSNAGGTRSGGGNGAGGNSNVGATGNGGGTPGLRGSPLGGGGGCGG